MHTSKEDYLINTLRFVSAKEATQIYGAILPESLTSEKVQEACISSTLYCPSSPEEPTKKSKRVKRHAKKSTKAPAGGVVIRETPVIPLFKKKEKITAEKRKGIDLLSEVALTEEAQYEEVRKKSLRDFHKTYPSGSGTVTKTAPSAAKIKPLVINEGTGVKPGVLDVTEEESSKNEDDEEEEEKEFVKTPSNNSNDEDLSLGMAMETGVKPGVPDVTEEESSESKVESWGNNEDDSNDDHDSSGEDNDQENDKENEEDIGDDEEEVKDEFVKTPSNDSDDEDKAKITDKAEGDEDEEMDYPTSQLYDDVDIRLNEQLILINATNPQFAPLDFASVFQFNNRVTALEKEVSELKKDPLNTQVTALVDYHLDARLGATIDEFMNYLSASITARITEQVKIQLPQILPKEVSNFAPPEIQRMVTESLEHVVLAKKSSQPQSSYEAAATLTEFELKKILIDKMDKSESYLAAPEHRECYEGLIKSYDLNKTLFSNYGKVYSLKRSQKDKDKDEDPSAGSD
ncbi:hypothetical protein Tco_0714853 [Tanacetum coccineum]